MAALASALLLLALTACATTGTSPRDVSRAAKRGDVVRLEAALAAGASPEGRRKSDRTPLHEAARHGHARAVEVLLAYGARIDSRDRP